MPFSMNPLNPDIKLAEHELPDAVPYQSMGEECGVLGMISNKTQNLGHLLFYGLYALQHRGQESCGMAVFDNDQLRIHKDMGLVNQVFTASVLEKMTGQVGIGHTRYSTTGSSNLDNAQPVVVRTRLGAVTLAHNGNLINTNVLEAFLEEKGYTGYGDSDSHLVAHYIRYALQQKEALGKLPLKEAVKEALEACEGAFSMVISTGDTMIAVRDRNGLRPLCYGKTASGTIVVASETCALDIVGADYVRDIYPGEIFVAKRNGATESFFLDGKREEHFCFFELVYFARPDSLINGSSIYNYRMGLGRKLAQISPNIKADMVIPVPDSGNVAAVGYSHESGIPYMEGLIKNRYVGRTFIHPTPELRERSIQLKLNPLLDVLKDKSVVVIDDSVVRGNTSKKLVKMLRDCGVREIHFCVSSAQVKHPCFYGIDMSVPSELIANKMTIEEIQQWLGVESLVYLSVDDMREVGNNMDYCMACFNSEYPAGKPEEEAITVF